MRASFGASSKWPYIIVVIIAVGIVVANVRFLALAGYPNDFYLATGKDAYALPGVPKDTLKGFTFVYEPQDNQPVVTRVNRYLEAAGAVDAAHLKGKVEPDIRVYDTPASRQEIVMMVTTEESRREASSGTESFIKITDRHSFEYDLASTILWIIDNLGQPNAKQNTSAKSPAPD